MKYGNNVIEDVETADLHIDAIYKGGTTGKGKSDEVLHRLLPGISNSSGFRVAARGARGKVVVLYSSGRHPDWPDALDPYRGSYTYYGDNRTPGSDLHSTPRAGNKTLQKSFELADGDMTSRSECPIFLLFEKVQEKGHDVKFLGLAVPGSPNSASREEDLVAIWKAAGGVRFQNYKATFTVLDTGTVSGEWIRDVIAGTAEVNGDPRTPAALTRWVERGTYVPLRSQEVREGRSREQQIPTTPEGQAIVEAIRQYCEDDYFFEVVAGEIWKMSISEPMDLELTRRYRDGGRDAVGGIWVGPNQDRILLSFSLEAKHYGPSNGVGVKDMSRLISRIRHREFGVFVTTSYVSDQAYKEVRADGHPIVIISAVDIVEILARKQITTVEACQSWLEQIIDPRVQSE